MQIMDKNETLSVGESRIVLQIRMIPIIELKTQQCYSPFIYETALVQVKSAVCVVIFNESFLSKLKAIKQDLLSVYILCS